MRFSAQLLLAVVALAARAEIVDRVAVTVGNQVITESDIHNQLRLTAFLNGEKPSFTPGQRRAAAERLVEQALLRKEMEISRFPAVDAAPVNNVLANLRSQRFPTDSQYQAALKEYGITGQELRQHLSWQLTILRFIDFRFSPGIRLTGDELRNYYEKEFLPKWRARTQAPPPSMQDSYEEIERGVNAKKADESLDEWLKTTRAQTAIVFHEEAFR